MKDNIKENLNPEDYWKDAEKILDNHFRKKRNRKIVLLLLLLFTSSGSFYWFANKNDKGVKNTAYTEPLKTVQASEKQGEIKSEVTQQKVIVSQSIKDQPVKVSNTLRENKKKQNASSFPMSVGTVHHVDKKRVEVALKSRVPGEDKITRYELKEINTSVDDSAAELPASIIRDASLENKADESLPVFADLELITALNATLQNNNTVALHHLESETGNVKLRSRWDLIIYGTSQLAQKTPTGNFDKNYLQRRNTEEHNVWLPGAGVQFSHSINNWDVRVGLEFSMLGEKVKYSPYSKGEYYRNYKQWQNYEYTIEDVDTTFIFGIPFYHSQQVVVTDSSLVDKTDTLNGEHYNESIATANGLNKYSLIEVPIEVVYRIQSGRFGAGVSVGLATGVVISSKGHYLRGDETGVESLKNSYTGDVVLNLRGGIEFSYMINERLKLLAKPNGKFYVTNLKEKNGADSKYKTIGVNLGLMYMIH